MSFQDGLQTAPQPSGYFCHVCGAIFFNAQDFQSHMSSHQAYASQAAAAVGPMAVYPAATVLDSKPSSRAGGSSASSSNSVTSVPSSSALQTFTGYAGSNFSGSLSSLPNSVGYGLQTADTSASDNLLCLSQVAVHQLATQSLQGMLLAKRSVSSSSASQQVSGGGHQVITSTAGYAAATSNAAGPSGGTGSLQHLVQQHQQQQAVQHQQQQLQQYQQHQQHQHALQLQHIPMSQHAQPTIALNLYSVPTHLYGQQPNVTVTPIGTLYAPAAAPAVLHHPQAFSHHSAALSASGGGSALLAPQPLQGQSAMAGVAGPLPAQPAVAVSGLMQLQPSPAILSLAGSAVNRSVGLAAPVQPSAIPLPPGTAANICGNGVSSCSTASGGYAPGRTTAASLGGESMNWADGRRLVASRVVSRPATETLASLRSGVDILAEATKQVLLGDLVDQSSSAPDRTNAYAYGAEGSYDGGRAAGGNNHGGDAVVATAMSHGALACTGSDGFVGPVSVTVRSEVAPATEEHLDELTGVRTHVCQAGAARVSLSFTFVAPEQFAQALDSAVPSLLFQCRQCDHVSADLGIVAMHAATHRQTAQQQLLPIKMDSDGDGRGPGMPIADGTASQPAVAAGGLTAAATDSAELQARRLSSSDVRVTAVKARGGRSAAAMPSSSSAIGKNGARAREREYECARCGDTLPSLKRYAAHRRQCLKARRRRKRPRNRAQPLRLNCPVADCGQAVAARERAAYRSCHRVATNDDRGCTGHVFVCHECTSSADPSNSTTVPPEFATWSQCMEHLLDKHEEVREVFGHFRCEACNAVLSSRQKLNRHAHAQHGVSFPQWKCSACGEQTFGEDCLDAHISRCCASGSRPGVAASAAATCGLTTAAATVPGTADGEAAAGSGQAAVAAGSSLSVARRHASMVSCRGCGKKFLNDSRLQRHLLTNACSVPAPRTYSCEYCSKAFARKSMLINHQIWCLYQTKSSDPAARGYDAGSHGGLSTGLGGGGCTADDSESKHGGSAACGKASLAAAAASALDSLAAAAIAAFGPMAMAEAQSVRTALTEPCSVTSPAASSTCTASSAPDLAQGKPVGAKNGARAGVTSSGSGKKAGGGASTDKVRHKCPQANCFTVLGSERELSVHQQCHTKDNHELQCFKCNFVPTHNHWFPLKEHFIAMHEGTLEAKFKCLTCGKGFAKQKKYSEHLKIHSEDKTYQCTECTMSFKQQCSLRHHVICAHADPALKEAAANESALKKKPAEERKAHLCHICGYSTDSGSYFTTHMNIHKGVKPYSCQFCAYESVDRACFKRHLWRHKADKPYKCCLCSYAGIQKAQLVAHMKTKHLSPLDGTAGSSGPEGSGSTGAEGDGSSSSRGVTPGGSGKGRRRVRRAAANVSAASAPTAAPANAPIEGASYRILSVVGTDMLVHQNSLVLAAAGGPERMSIVGSGGGMGEAGLGGAGPMTAHHVMQLPLPDYLSSFYSAAAAAAATQPSAAGGGAGSLHALLL